MQREDGESDSESFRHEEISGKPFRICCLLNLVKDAAVMPVIVYESPLAERLRSLRKRSGFGVQEVAERLGKSAGYISRIERRGDVPTPELLCEIAGVYGVSARGLLDLAQKSQVERFSLELEAKYRQALARHLAERKQKPENR